MIQPYGNLFKCLKPEESAMEKKYEGMVAGGEPVEESKSIWSQQGGSRQRNILAFAHNFQLQRF